MAAVERGLQEWDRDAIHHFRFPRDAIEDVFRTLVTESMEDRMHNPGLEPARADVIVAGACIFRSEEHTSELQSLMRISYAVFCLKKKKKQESKKTKNQSIRTNTTHIYSNS